MKRLTILALILLPSLCFSQLQSTAWLDGNWKGLGFQPGNGTTWQAKLSFSEALSEASIYYPGLKCSGSWDIMTIKNKQITFTEVITEGKQQCVNGSKIVVTALGETYIHVAWFSDYIEGVDAYAVLKRDISFLNGRWIGIGFQTNNGHTWQTVFEFNDSQKTANIYYPDLNCKGKWLFVGFDGVHAVFEEQITDGKNNCIDGSTIYVSRVDNDYINVAWNTNFIDDIDAYAVLKKKQQQIKTD
jgi:hypothetical protein